MKLKRILALLFCFAMLFSLFACSETKSEGQGAKEPSKNGSGDKIQGTQQQENPNGGNGNLQGKPSGNYIDVNNVHSVSKYSDGVMLAAVGDGLSAKWYVIEKNGAIVLEFPEGVRPMKDSCYSNGYVFVYADVDDRNSAQAVMDKKGGVILPSEVGAAHFYGSENTLAAGYLLAMAEDASYSGTTRKLGVLNLNRQWVVPLSETLYQELGYDYLYPEFVAKDRMYFQNGSSLNLKTGAVEEVENWKEITPSDCWRVCYYDARDQSVEVEAHGNRLFQVGAGIGGFSQYNNGKAVIVYHNSTADKDYVTLINEKGEHLFEPVELSIHLSNSFKAATDGNYIVVYGGSDGFVVLDSKGTTVKTFKMDMNKNNVSTITFEEGVLVVNGWSMATGRSKNWSKAYDIHFNELFVK